MSEIEKDERGNVKYTRSVKSKLHNGYDLSLTAGTANGIYLDEAEYWSTEPQLLLSHSAFFNYIRDFGLPRKGDCIIDSDGEYLRVYDIFINYEEDTPTIEIEFT